MTHPETNPFQPDGRRRGLGRVAIVVAALVTALAVWRFSARTPAPAASGHEGHDMAAMTAGAGAARPVTLGESDRQLIGVTFAAVEAADLVRRVRTVGIVSVDESRRTAVTTKVEGWVERLRVDFTGQRVAAGDVLFDLYAPDVVTAQEELLLGRKLLASLGDATSEARRSAEELVAASRRRLAYWDVSADEIARAESTAAVSRTFSVRARAAGYAVEKSVVAGQRVMPGDVLYQLADLGVVWIEGEVYERDLASIRLGDPVEARFAALPGTVRRGKVTYVYPTVDADTRTARVRLELPNPGYVLRPGMYATLEIAAPARSALTIPRSAALVTGQRTLVFLKRADGRFEPREVTLGAPDDDRYEVLGGLAPGDTVVASGTFLLDAESNLGTMLGGMGGMPGMDMAPAGAPPAKPESAGAGKQPPAHQHR
ncbi:MAG: efflux RND transporter periplasmic adaptor subunit [Gemmatimonadales bacterium]